MRDPYCDIISSMRRQSQSVAPPGIKIAEVVSPPPKIIIKMGDLQLDKDNILIADYLIPKYERKITIPLTASTSTVSKATVGDHGEHTHQVTKIGIANGTIQFADTLKPGDTVLAVPTADGQTYIILARVVKCDG